MAQEAVTVAIPLLPNGSPARHDDPVYSPEQVTSPSKAPGGHGLSEGQTWFDSVRVVGWTVYVPSVFFGLADGVIISAVPLLARGMGSSDKVVGLTAAASLIGKLIADIPAGGLHERWGGGVAMTMGLMGVCLSALMAYLSRSPWLLIAALILTGCSEAIFSVSRGSVVRNAVPAQHRGRAVALLGGINRISRAVGPICSAWLTLYFGLWSTMLLRAGCAATGAAILHSQVVTEEHDSHLGSTLSASASHGDGKPAPAAPSSGCLAAARSILDTLEKNWTSIATGGLVAFTLALIRQARNVVLSLKGDNVGLSIENIGLAFSLGYAFDSLMFIPVGWAMDKYGRKTCGVPAFFVISLGLLMIPAVSSVEGLVAASVLLAFGNGLSSGLLMTIGTDLAPRAFAGQFIGVWHLICDGGALCGPVLLGLISDATTLDTSSMLCGAVGIAGGLWFLICLPETLRAHS